MNLNELIEELEDIRALHGGDIPVQVEEIVDYSTYEKYTTPVGDISVGGSFRTGRTVVIGV